MTSKDVEALAARANFLVISGENCHGYEDVPEDVRAIHSLESFHRPTVRCPCMPELMAIGEDNKRIFAHKRQQ